MKRDNIDVVDGILCTLLYLGVIVIDYILVTVAINGSIKDRVAATIIFLLLFLAFAPLYMAVVDTVRMRFCHHQWIMKKDSPYYSYGYFSNQSKKYFICKKCWREE